MFDAFRKSDLAPNEVLPAPGNMYFFVENGLGSDAIYQAEYQGKLFRKVLGTGLPDLDVLDVQHVYNAPEGNDSNILNQPLFIDRDIGVRAFASIAWAMAYLSDREGKD